MDMSMSSVSTVKAVDNRPSILSMLDTLDKEINNLYDFFAALDGRLSSITVPLSEEGGSPDKAAPELRGIVRNISPVHNRLCNAIDLIVEVRSRVQSLTNRIDL